jgi:hypothetical protein
MGVHDFSSAIYSRGELEGSQCLSVPPKVDSGAQYGSGILTDEWFGEGEADKNDLEEALAGDDIPNPAEVYDELGYEPFEGYGETQAVLEIFIFPADINVTNDNFSDSVAKKLYRKRYFKEYEYHWDGWDFVSGEERTEENWMNYRDSSDGDMPIVWQVKEGEYKPRILSENPNSQVWVRNFTKQEYDFYVMAATPCPEMTNFDLAYTAYLLDIDYRNKTRQETFSQVRAAVMREFNFDPIPNLKK